MRAIEVTCNRCGSNASKQGEWTVTGYHHKPFLILRREAPNGYGGKVVSSGFDLCGPCKGLLINWLNEIANQT